MRTPRIDRHAIRNVRWWEHALRFVFGGAVTVGAGFVAQTFGPSVGGLFLAFPAILPAALTLVEIHDGCEKAADDARGAQLGAVGLAAFGWVVAVLADRWENPAFVLAAALCAWGLVSSSLWLVRFGLRR